MISEYCSLSAVSEMADSEYELRYACPAATESATQPLPQSSDCKHLRAQTVAINRHTPLVCFSISDVPIHTQDL